MSVRPPAISIMVNPPRENPAAPMRLASTILLIVLSASMPSITARRSRARSQRRMNPSSVLTSSTLLPGWFTAAVTKPRRANATPSQAS